MKYYSTKFPFVFLAVALYIFRAVSRRARRKSTFLPSTRSDGSPWIFLLLIALQLLSSWSPAVFISNPFLSLESQFLAYFKVLRCSLRFDIRSSRADKENNDTQLFALWSLDFLNDVLPISHDVVCRNLNVEKRPPVILLNYLSLSPVRWSSLDPSFPSWPSLPLHAILGGNIVAPLVLILKLYKRGRLSLITYDSYARSSVAIIRF